MKLIRGVFVSSPWETGITYFISLKEKHGLSTRERLAEMYASQVYVTLAIFEDETLDWVYKLKRLIDPKDFKSGNGLLDMLIAQLNNTVESLQAALRLRGAWCELEHVQKALLRNPNKPLDLFKVQCVVARVLENVTSLLSSLRAYENRQC